MRIDALDTKITGLILEVGEILVIKTPHGSVKVRVSSGFTEVDTYGIFDGTSQSIGSITIRGGSHEV